MASAVRRYAEHHAGLDAWALGRFVVPAARLPELERHAKALAPHTPAGPWRLSVLLGAAPADGLEALGEFNCRHAAVGDPTLSADSVEAKADSVAAIDRLLDLVPAWAHAYVELPLDRDPAPLVAALARRGGRAKARTGGVTPDAFPAPADLLRFLRACTAADVPFKATAGLHHPLRGEYRLTYAPGSPAGTMFGFLNLFLAAAFLRQGLADADTLRLLEERDPRALRVESDVIEWRGHQLTRAAIDAARAGSILSFGSCSFTEPVDEARHLGWA
jgi:hypothetical protein